MQASIGVSAGPVRLSQGLPGCGAILAAVPVIAVLGGMGLVRGLTVDAVTTFGDGNYAAVASAPEGTKVETGTYRTTTPAKPTGDNFNDGKCHWWIQDGSGNDLREASRKAAEKPGASLTLRLESGDYLSTSNCGTWVKVS